MEEYMKRILVCGIALVFLFNTAVFAQGNNQNLQIQQMGQKIRDVIIKIMQDTTIAQKKNVIMEELEIPVQQKLGIPEQQKNVKEIREKLVIKAEPLTPEQRKQIQELREEWQKQRVKIEADNKVAHIELNQILRDSTATESAIKSQLEKIAQNDVALKLGEIKLNRAINDLLTPEQRKAKIGLQALGQLGKQVINIRRGQPQPALQRRGGIGIQEQQGQGQRMGAGRGMQQQGQRGNPQQQGQGMGVQMRQGRGNQQMGQGTANPQQQGMGIQMRQGRGMQQQGQGIGNPQQQGQGMGMQMRQGRGNQQMGGGMQQMQMGRGGVQGQGGPGMMVPDINRIQRAPGRALGINLSGRRALAVIYQQFFAPRRIRRDE
jgi:Spy/CpxP family protein refolding chaperone